jgi:hypothetical protein
LGYACCGGRVIDDGITSAKEAAGEHGVDAGGVEAAHGIARRAHQGLADPAAAGSFQ